MAADSVPDLRGRLALRAGEMALALGVSERKLRDLTPEMPHVRRDGVLLYPVEGVRKWLEDAAKAEQVAAQADARAIVHAVTDRQPKI